MLGLSEGRQGSLREEVFGGFMIGTCFNSLTAPSSSPPLHPTLNVVIEVAYPSMRVEAVHLVGHLRVFSGKEPQRRNPKINIIGLRNLGLFAKPASSVEGG